MTSLPLANILHYKLRSLLSALGIGVGVCMMMALSGLARGSLFENADRWESVGADLIVFPRGWAKQLGNRGVGLSVNYGRYLREQHGDLVRRTAPVFSWPMKLGGQDHVASGIRAEDWDLLSGGRPLLRGRLPDPDGAFAAWLRQTLLQPVSSDEPDAPDEPLTLSAEELVDRGGLELVLDARLAAATGLDVGDVVRTANHEWTIVGIAPAGVMTRVYLPLATAQYLFGDGDITKATMIFLTLAPGADLGPAVRIIQEAIGQDVISPDAYRGLLAEKFQIMLVYVDIVNGIAISIAFLFVMVTLYTMVLQRTREIAILKSCGASNGYILRQVLWESALLTGLGVGIGVGLAFAAAWGIETYQPLLTVELTWRWAAIATGVAGGGALLAGLLPAWRAMRVDMVEALGYE
jgi:putative ABC transport system permease protein